MKRLPTLASLLLCTALPLLAHADSCTEVAVDGYKAPDYGCFCLLYTSPSPRDRTRSRMPSSA